MRNKDTGVPNTELGQDTILEELLRRASKDALSGLLNRATLERSIKERLKAMTPEETCWRGSISTAAGTSLFRSARR